MPTTTRLTKKAARERLDECIQAPEPPRTLNIIQQMFQAIRQRPELLTHHIADFTVIDTELISMARKGDMFAWSVRPSGTHLFYLNTDRGARNAIAMAREGKFGTEDITWFVIKVTWRNEASSEIVTGWPEGTLKPATAKQVISLAETVHHHSRGREHIIWES
jgi:hypothetical protein